MRPNEKPWTERALSPGAEEKPRARLRGGPAWAALAYGPGYAMRQARGLKVRKLQVKSVFQPAGASA